MRPIGLCQAVNPFLILSQFRHLIKTMRNSSSSQPCYKLQTTLRIFRLNLLGGIHEIPALDVTCRQRYSRKSLRYSRKKSGLLLCAVCTSHAGVLPNSLNSLPPPICGRRTCPRPRVQCPPGHRIRISTTVPMFQSSKQA